MKKITLLSKQLLHPTLIIALLLVNSVRAAESVSIESLLNEMIDRERVARYPEQDFRLKQHSSYNRASKTPDDSAGWFNNRDFSTKGKPQPTFIRVEENAGRKEWVLMDHEGAGAIVRTWMPFQSVPKGVILRFYFDGTTIPGLEGNVCTLLNGEGLIPYPLAHKSLRSAVSFFPIPYAKSCKVTLSEQPFFFQFTFREYMAGTPVKTFTMDDFNATESLTKTVGRSLLDPQLPDNESPHALSETLAPGQEKSLKLPSGAPAAVREMMVKLGSYEDPSVTRSVVLKMEFDGKETVWCPVGDFFGTGIGLNPFQGWYRTVVEDGTMSCRWVMPYHNSGKVYLVNLANKAVDVQLEVTTGDWNWDERSMYFNAAWRWQYPVATRPYSDWNYVTLKGRGVYVGDTLTIMNPVEKWWGEGDEKIWVDGENFPSIFGTGTEDYYGYSWGGVSTDFYEHPFHAQPRSHVYNKLNRKTSNERNSLGYSTETRSRSLDTIPFGSSLQLDMEVWSWTDCEMGYGVGMYWYGDAAATSNRKPDPEGVLNIPPIPDMRNAAAGKQGKTPVARGALKNAVECKAMKVVFKPGSIVLKPQNLKQYKGLWSADNHLLFKGAKVGDVVELSIPASSPVAERLVLYATKSYDFGILKLTVNGKSAGPNVDLYASAPTSSGPIELGVFDPVDSAYVLRIEVVGQNPKSKGAFFGIDCVTLNVVK